MTPVTVNSIAATCKAARRSLILILVKKPKSGSTTGKAKEKLFTTTIENKDHSVIVADRNA